MKKITFLLIAVLFASYSFAQSNISWRLIFEDNFDGTSFNSTNWGYSTWEDLFIPSLVEVKNGNLILTSQYGTDGKVHGGGINTQRKFNFLYGKVEVRARLKTGGGAFSAIWMMPENESAGWPACGEVDIMEQISTESNVYQTAHSYYTYTLGIKNPANSGHPSVSVTNYNVYGLQWYPDRLEFAVNGAVTFTYPRIITNQTGQWPFDKAFYIKLEQKAGGSWAGTPNQAAMPFTMEVDWVKVYQSDTLSTYATPTWSNSSYAFNSTRWKDEYVKTITSTGAKNNVAYTASAHPSSYSVVYPDTLILHPNSTFSLNLISNSLGAYNESTILQDLRYTHCTAFADFDGDKIFETVLPTIGNAPPTNGVGGNYTVMNVTQNISVPNKRLKNGRIRVVYRGAWSTNISPELSLIEGMVYDFNIKIVEKGTGLAQNKLTASVNRKGNNAYLTDLKGKCIITVLDFTGKVISQTITKDPSLSIILPTNSCILKIQNDAGEIYSKKM